MKNTKSGGVNGNFSDYVSGRYESWVSYAESLCLKYGVRLDAREAVNESFRVLLERNGHRLDRLMAARPGKEAVADFMMKRVIRFQVCFPKSGVRYKSGQKFTSESSEETPETFSDTNVDYSGFMQSILEQVPFTDLERRIFVWVAIEGKRLDDWPGEESRRKLFYKQRSAILKVRMFLRRQKLTP